MKRRRYYHFIRAFRKNVATLKTISFGTTLAFLVQLVSPLSLMASNGPNAQETKGVSVGHDYVNLFTGDFQYSIPLLDIEGYPLNLNYSSAGITMERDAGWVGLGWSLNTGAINRQKRGVPDDFKFDEYEEITTYKNRDVHAEAVGFKKGTFTLKESTSGPYEDSYHTSIGTEDYYHEIPGLFWGKGFVYKNNSLNGITKQTIESKGSLVTVFQNLKWMAGSFLIGSATVVGSASLSANLRSTLTEDYSSRQGLLGKSTSLNMGLNASAGIITIANAKGSVGMTSTSSQSFSTPSLIPFSKYSTISNGFGASAIFHKYVNANGKADIIRANDNSVFIRDTSDLQSLGYKAMHEVEHIHAFNGIIDSENESHGPIQAGAYQNLPVHKLNYDLFTATGSNLNANFRLRSKAVHATPALGTYIKSLDSTFTITDRINSVTTSSGMATSTTESRDWERNNNTIRGFKNYPLSSPAQEQSYFQAFGESTVFDQTHWDGYGDYDSPVAIAIDTANGDIEASAEFLNLSGSSTNIPSNFSLPSTRAKRNLFISQLTATEAKDYGLEKKIKDYAEFTSSSIGFPSATEENRVTTSRKAHHFSEISVLNSDGWTNVYGIPVYSMEENNVRFAIGQTNLTINSDNTVTYVENGSTPDNSDKNTRGRNNLYSKQKSPAYATSYLLSTVLSDDYSDRTNNGPSEDDFGQYLHFKYSKIYDDYAWRIPYADDANNPIAYLQQGYLSDELDDVASYSFGEKEVWYPNSIESKKYVVEFYLEDREDAYASNDENGGRDLTKPLKYLSEIRVYAKEDRKDEGLNATPIKTVHFEYDYSLCSGYPANKNSGSNDGKLTLKKVWFTHADSDKGGESPFEFEYGHNEDYALQNFDRWGSYREYGTGLSIDNYPYAEQNASDADDWAAAWCLDSIHLPTGGGIGVRYEADRYGYVQDKVATKMVKVAGLGDSETHTAGNETKLYIDEETAQAYIFFDLESTITGSKVAADKEVRRLYAKDLKYVYGKFLVDLDGDGSEEYISTWMRMMDIGAEGSSAPFDEGFIKVEVLDDFDQKYGQLTLFENEEEHPMVATAIVLGKSHLQDVLFNDSWNIDEKMISPDETDVHYYLDFLAMENGYAQTIDLDYSWIKLDVPDREKLGGGNRVSKIHISDGWDQLTTESGHRYTQLFTYELEDGQCSGVASFEPTVGGDENALRKPYFLEYNGGLNDDPYSILSSVSFYQYQETPFGESLYPGAQVGYSRIVTSTSSFDQSNRNSIGPTISKYYTSKDFPTIRRKTKLHPKRYLNNKSVVLSWEYDAWYQNARLHDNNQILLSEEERDLYGYSQGYTIENNDMHGKLRSVEHLDLDQNVVLAKKIEYQSSRNPFGYGLRLDNEVDLLAKNGNTASGTISTEQDIFVEMLDQYTRSESYSDEVKVKKVALWKNNKITEKTYANPPKTTGVKTAVVVKYLHKYGVVKSVYTKERNAEITVTNLAYDEDSGIPVLTEFKNEWEDPKYSLSFKGSWAYDKLGMACLNQGITIESVAIASGGVATITDADDYFVRGDIVGHNGNEYWVDEVTSTTIKLLGINGNKPTASAADLKILKSGRSNQHLSDIQTVTLRKNPLVNNQIVLDQVLDVGAAEFADDWKTYSSNTYGCADTSVFCGPEEECDTVSDTEITSDCDLYPGDTYNPFIHNTEGRLRPYKSYTYDGTRTYDPGTVSSTDLRNNGEFSTFEPYWAYSATDGKYVPITHSNHPDYSAGSLGKWRKEMEREVYDPNGTLLQARNKSEHVQSGVFGYHATNPELTTATALMAEHEEIGYEGFEDIDYLSTFHSCDYKGGWGFKHNLNTTYVVSEAAHTGEKSLKLYGGSFHTSSNYIVNCGVNTSASNVLDTCQCINGFNPKVDGRYLVSGWLKEGSDSNFASVDSAGIRIIVRNASGNNIFNQLYLPQGRKIEGWARVEADFEIPSGAACIAVRLENNDTRHPVYFDDIRVQPFHAAMETIVYDGDRLRIRSKLDARNYARFYKYNNEGAVTKMDVETPEGISTISETRTGVHK